MKGIVSLLVCFFAVIATFQHCSANSTSTTADFFPSRQFATPEQTWDIFKTSILAGDYDMAIKCCCDGKTNSVSRFERMAENKRKNLVQSMQPIKPVDLRDNTAKYEVTRDINGVEISTFIFFEKINDEWKIARY